MRWLYRVLWVLILACSGSTSPHQGADVVSFELEGQELVFYSNTEFVSASVNGNIFTLHASDPVEGRYLDFTLSQYRGPASYALGEGTGYVRLVSGGVSYEGRGTLAITSAQCSTRTAYDPVTGITGPETTCHLAGTFAFTGASQTGPPVSVTHGRFRATSIRGAG